MLTLYTKYKVEPERFQYEDIFRSRSEDALERIEFLYQDLECQYHLVQAAPRSHPNVPGLTPVGFAKWIISNILAYPDPEARRLHAIMSALPINADGPLLNGKPERLPRQLSRHLFPASHDKKVRKILDEAVWDCLEDVAPPLPSIPRARPGPSQDLARVPEANTHARRPGGGPRRPAPVPHRRTYDRGSHRVEPHPARLPRANSDAGASLPRHPPRRVSVAAVAAHLGVRYPGSDANYGVCSGRGSDSRDRSPRSPGLSRRGGAGAGADRGPTWEEVYSRKGSSGGRVSSVDAEPHRSSR
ncbi:hydroxyproline-rich glycoprotein DZ-HRGP [Colletotrichum tofieldiae]|nr:hydroxyproline-rich glycoprotein DZ-HRGP [Colletotrichum tofieldiae]